MKRFTSAALAVATLAAGGGAAVMPAAAEEGASRVPLRMWYGEPGTLIHANRNDALPLGNGFIGGLVYGGVAQELIIVNEHTLWGGGPGASASYNGGISGTKENTHAALRELRTSLQDKMTAFTRDHAAHMEDGRLVTANYPEETAREKELINTLMGSKNGFGSYQELGRIQIDQPELPYTGYERGLELDTAVAYTTYTQGGVTYTREYFTSLPGNVMAIRLTASQNGKLSPKISLTSLQSNKTVSAAADGTVTMTGRPSDQTQTKHLEFAQQLRVIPVGGSMAVSGGTDIQVTGADSVLILMSAGTNYQQCMDDTYSFFKDEAPLDAVAANVTAAAGKTWEQLKTAHVADYQALYDRVRLELGQTLPARDTVALIAAYKAGTASAAEQRYLETLYYQYGRYLLIACSREGSLPANLQGIWAPTLGPPWGADYHTNINLQMNYWHAETTNLAECHLPVVDYVNSLVPRGTAVAQHYYEKQDGGDVRGWTIHHENNIWANAAPGNYYWGFYFPAAAAWMCQDIWDYYDFTGDRDFLAANYDTILSAALFWVDNLWEDSRDGSLVANPSYSPEHGPYSLGASCDQAIIWQLFEEVRLGATALGMPVEGEIAEVAAAQAKLYMSSPGLGGQWKEWKDEITIDTNGDPEGGGNFHRHVNQLYAAHPGSYVVAGRSEEDDLAIEAMKRTLTIKGDGGATGWSNAWKINFWARLRDGEHAGLMVSNILKTFTMPNLLDSHNQQNDWLFQIDGNFGATSGMTEMLLQSQGDSIDFLPALPGMWADGSVEGLKARGNVTVGMSWQAGGLKLATLAPAQSGALTLRYEGIGKAVVKNKAGQTVSVTPSGDDSITFAAAAGEVYTVTDIPTPAPKKLSNPQKLLDVTVNNITGKTQMNQLGMTDDNGAVIEAVDPNSPLRRLGLRAGDVVTALNGAPVTRVEELMTLWAALPEGGTARMDYLRAGKPLETLVSLPEFEVDTALPARLSADGYDYLSNLDAKTGQAPDGGAYITGLGGEGYIRYKYINFRALPATVTVRVSAPSGGSVTLRAPYADSPPLAVINVPATGGADSYTDITLPVQNAPEGADEDEVRLYDLYVFVTGDVRLSWVQLGGAAALGDVSGDGKIDSTDARMVLQHEVKLITLDDGKKARADVNGDTKIDSTDARLILQYEVKLLDRFPAS